MQQLSLCRVAGLKRLPVHRYSVICTFTSPLHCRVQHVYWEKSCDLPGAMRREGCRICHYLINRLSQTVSAVFQLWMLYFQRISFQIICHVIRTQKLIYHFCLHIWLATLLGCIVYHLRGVWLNNLAENIMLKSVDANTQTWLTLLQETVRSILHHSGPVKACHYGTYVPSLWTGLDSHHDWLCQMLNFGDIEKGHAKVQTLFLVFLLELPYY